MQGWGKIKESAEYGGVSPRTVRRWLKEGLLHSRMPSGTILISRTAMDDFIRQFQITENEADRITNEVMEGI